MNQHDQSELLSRIEDLESRLAFQEQALETLSQALFSAQQANERLTVQVEWLSARSRELGERLPDMPSGDEPPPPHY